MHQLLILCGMEATDAQFFAVSSTDELRQYKKQWDDLNARSSQHPAMHSYAWISNHFKCFASAERSWTCLIAISNERLVAILPLVLRRRVWPVPHVVAQSAFGEHLNVTDILCDDADAENFLANMLDFAFRELPDIAYIEFPRVPVASPLAQAGFAASTRPIVFRTIASCGNYLPLPKNFDDYERSLSKNLRSNLKKATNKLAKLDNVEFEFLGPDANVQECFERFCAVESSGWKGRMGTAIGKSKSLVDFYLEVLPDLQQNGLLEWHFLKSADGDLAAHMVFRSNGRLILWKLAYNESFSACSPGNQLFRELIKREIRNPESAEIDLTTDQKWFRKWNVADRQYFQVVFHRRRSLLSTLYLAGRKFRESAKRSSLLRKIWTAFRSVRSPVPKTQ